MTGVGETLAPLRTPALHAVLVNPGALLATRVVYSAFDSSGLGRVLSPSPAPNWASLEQVTREAALRGNDLAATAAQLAPDIDQVLALLRADPVVHHANLSGSGATCFALVKDKDDAVGLAARVRAQRPSWWTVETVLGSA